MRFASALPCLLLVLQTALAAPPLHEHRVQPGDTLIGLRDELLRPEIGWQQLQRLNRVADPYRLQPGSLLRWPVDWQRERTVEAELLQLQGQVWRLQGDQRQPLVAGELLREGDRLQSGAQSSAVLRFVDGTRVLLRANSELDLQALRQQRQGGRSVLALQAGGLDAEVPPAEKKLNRPRLELRSPVANLGVRGTRLRSQRLEGGAQTLEVIEGQVEASTAGGRVQAVAAGQGWHSRSGREPLLPAPTVAALDGRVMQRLPVQLEWPAQPGAVAWRLEWWSLDGSRLLLDTPSSAPRFVGAAELPDGDYRLRLRARSASGIEGRDAEWRLSLQARPEPPVLESPPRDASSHAAEYRFAWTRPQDAAAYWLQIGDEPGFAQPRVDRRGLGEAELRVELPVGTHHWRVAALRADGRPGPWGDAQQLTRLAPPPSPPPAEPQRDGNALTLRWQAIPLAGARYQVQLAGSSDFATPWLDQSLDQPSLQFEMQHSGPQWLRIRVLTPDGHAGPWGTPQQLDGRRSPWWWLLGLPLLLLI
jgi:hypothetical protein